MMTSNLCFFGYHHNFFNQFQESKMHLQLHVSFNKRFIFRLLDTDFGFVFVYRRGAQSPIRKVDVQHKGKKRKKRTTEIFNQCELC